MSNKKLKRQVSNGGNKTKYMYKLVLANGKERWLSVSQLESRPEAVVTRKAISMRLHFMLENPTLGCTFKTVMDCISRPAMTRNGYTSGDTKNVDIHVQDLLMAMPVTSTSRTRKHL